MNAKRLVAISVVGLSCAAFTVTARAEQDDQSAATGLVQEVRRATRDFRDVSVAMAAGYAPATGCVSGPEEGAMGLHFANGDLVGDGVLDPERPELLLYEQRNRRLRLLGVEYLVIAEAWHARNEGPPVLMGQQFHYAGSPNRYGLPPFYELHVWAWKDNPHGMFVDWNPAVSCEEHTAEDSAHSQAAHGSADPRR